MHVQYFSSINALPQLPHQWRCSVNNENSKSKMCENLHLESAWFLHSFLGGWHEMHTSDPELETTRNWWLHCTCIIKHAVWCKSTLQNGPSWLKTLNSPPLLQTKIGLLWTRLNWRFPDRSFCWTGEGATDRVQWSIQWFHRLAEESLHSQRTDMCLSCLEPH